MLAAVTSAYFSVLNFLSTGPGTLSFAHPFMQSSIPVLLPGLSPAAGNAPLTGHSQSSFSLPTISFAIQVAFSLLLGRVPSTRSCPITTASAVIFLLPTGAPGHC